MPEDELAIVPIKREDDAALFVGGPEVRSVTLAGRVFGHEPHVMPPLAKEANVRGGKVLVREDLHLPIGNA